MSLKYTVTVNQPQVDKKMGRISKDFAEKRFKKDFEQLKSKMIGDFYNHPVTQDLLNNRSDYDTSGSNAPTSLFGFIGFNESADPISPIIKLLTEQTKYQYIGYKPFKGHLFQVELPEAKDIFNITPMPWAVGRSWAQGIESGISGVGFTLNKPTNSRSGVAIQSSKQIRVGKFKNQAYVSSLLKEYQKLFKKL